MTLSFIHAADIHLDSPLRGLAAYDNAPLARLRNASRRAFSRLIDAAIARRVDLLLLAGDIWDGDWPDIGAGLYFVREMGRLRAAGIPVYMIRGNHDAESRITKALSFPDNVHVFASDRAETVRLEPLGVALHGQSFARRDVTENIALHYPPAVPGLTNIGLLHTALEGSSQHANYAPCRLDDLTAKGYDYWALGHVHDHALRAGGDEGTADGAIAYSGVLQGRHARETGAKGALLVNLNERGAQIERLICDSVRWLSLDVDIAGAQDFADIATGLAHGLRQLRDPDGPSATPHAEDLPIAEDLAEDDRLFAVRLRLIGRTPLNGRLRRDPERARQEAIAQAMLIDEDGLFIEKVVCATDSPYDDAALAERRDAFAELAGILARAEDDTGFAEALKTEINAFRAQLPGEIDSALSEEKRLDTLLPDACVALLDSLSEG